MYLELDPSSQPRRRISLRDCKSLPDHVDQADDQYNNMYRCQVTNPGTGQVVGTPQPAKLCAGSSSTCVKGPKQPNVSLF
jgi:hypothetical protein